MLLPFITCALMALPTAPQEPGSPLARALDAIRTDELRADVYFFADPELKGRDTPSNEQRVAARFLRARLERLGLTPGAGTGWFHEYPMHVRKIDEARTSLVFSGVGDDWRLVFGRDYFFPSSSDIVSLEREAAIVFCGRGEKADFEAVQVADKFALCVVSDMPARRRMRNAEKAGALGLILIPAPDGDANPAPAECQRTTEYALKGVPSFRPGAASEDPEALGQVFLTLDAARQLCERAGNARALPALGSELPLRAHEVRDGSGAIALENVCALWPGSDPVLSKEVLIVSAHYDHVGLQGGKIHPGADDNASGSMGLLALAQALKEHGPMRRSVLLMWLSGEEKGLWGSAAWTQAPVLPPGHRAVANVNIDMIGRNAPDYLLITPTKALGKEYNGLTKLAEQLSPLEGFPKLGSADQYWQRSDHMNFAVNLKIPVAFLFSDVHADYHEPTDTAEKLDYDKIRRVTRLVLRMLAGLQNDTLPS